MLKRKYIYFWLTGMVIIIYHIKYPNGHLNFNVDSHVDFEIQKQSLNDQKLAFLITISFFLGVGASYWLIEKFKLNLKRRLTQIHLFITLGITWALCILVFYSFYFPNKFISLVNNSTFESITNILLLFIVVAQVLFLINVAFGIREKRASR